MVIGVGRWSYGTDMCVSAMIRSRKLATDGGLREVQPPVTRRVSVLDMMLSFGICLITLQLTLAIIIFQAHQTTGFGHKFIVHVFQNTKFHLQNA
jgi:hypothetical protein